MIFLTTIQGIKKDSINKKKLWSKYNFITIEPNNYASCISVLTDDMVAKKHSDTILITTYCDEHQNNQGHNRVEGRCYELRVIKNKYEFINKSWTDALSNNNIKYEYSPFYLNKEQYSMGDTLIGCVTIKQIKLSKDEVVETNYLKFVVNTIVIK